MSLLTLTSPSSALILCLLSDVVVLKNGSEVQGEIVKETDERVILKFPGGVMELPRRQVQAVRRQPRGQYLLETGEMQIRRGNYEDATATFHEALREAPDSSRARDGLLEAQERQASMLRSLGRYDEAKKLYGEILEAQPKHLRATEEVRSIEKTMQDGLSEEARAIEEISGGNLEKGIWRLQLVYDHFADRRKPLARTLGTALIRRGDDLLRAGDCEGAETQYLRALTLDPELLPMLERQYVVARQRQIVPLVEAGRFADVEEKALDGLEVSPTNEVLRYYLALCKEARGKSREAAEEYLSITGGKRPASLEEAVGKLRMEVEAKLVSQGKVPPVASPHATETLSGDFRELKTEHFLVEHKNPSVARDVAFVAERSYARIFREIGCVAHLRSPLRIVVFPTHDEYIAASGQSEWSAGSHRIARRMGNLSDHRIFTYQGQPRLTSGVLPHEIAHALLLHRLNYPERIPLWANEGFAVTQEPSYFQRHFRRVVAQELTRRTTIPLAELLTKEDYPEDRVEAFYAQSFSLVEFLISLEDLPTFLAFLKLVSGPGADVEGGLKRFYKVAGRQALESRWIAWLEKRLKG